MLHVRIYAYKVHRKKRKMKKIVQNKIYHILAKNMAYDIDYTVQPFVYTFTFTKWFIGWSYNSFLKRKPPTQLFFQNKVMYDVFTDIICSYTYAFICVKNYTKYKTCIKNINCQ